MIFEKFSLDDLVEEVQATKKLIEKMGTEIKMWRVNHLKINNYSSKAGFYLLAEPAGIENIQEWEEELKCCLETHEKIK